MIDFGLIKQYYLLLVLYSPVLVSIGKIQTSFVMPSRKNRTFGLDYSFHTSFLQVEVDGTGRERLVDNVDK